MILRTTLRRTATQPSVDARDAAVRRGQAAADRSGRSSTPRPSRGPSRRGSLIGALVLSALLIAATASARDEVLRWTHPDPSGLARFEALVGSSSGSYGAPISLGLPSPDGSGIYTATISVGDNDDVYIALQAVDTAGVASFPSNERFRPAPGSGGGSTGGTTGGGSTGGSGGATSLAEGTEIPPQPGATLRVDFDSGAATDWVDTGADNSLSTNDGLFSVVNVGSNPALSTTSSLTNIHSHYVGSPSNMNNLIFTGRMGIDNGGGGIGVTAYSQYPSADLYYRLRSTPGDTFRLSGHPHNCSGNENTGVALQTNVWFEYELTITNESAGTRIAAKVWRQGDTKPSTAQAECLDTQSNRNLSGTIGVWSMGSGGKFWDDLEVTAASGAGGASGPVSAPILISVDPVN